MGKVNVDVRVRPLDGGRVAVRVVYQSPSVLSFLPFRASDGTVITVVASGRPCAGEPAGNLTLGLRGADCPDEYRSEPAVASVSDGAKAAGRIRAAVRELRDAINAAWTMRHPGGGDMEDTEDMGDRT